jgi:uncharacterized protein
MALLLDPPDYAFRVRQADGHSATVNDDILHESFALLPERMLGAWPATRADALDVALLAPLLDASPQLIVLGTGTRQVFPPAVVVATCLQRGIGLEVMDNAAAARTYGILAGEGRRVLLAMILSGD